MTYLFGCTGSWLWHLGSSVIIVAHGFLVVACGIKFPDQGSNLGSLHWDYEFLATGPPGKSPVTFLLALFELEVLYADRLCFIIYYSRGSFLSF